MRRRVGSGSGVEPFRYCMWSAIGRPISARFSRAM